MTEQDKRNLLLNLVSRGMSLQDARIKVYGAPDGGPKGEAIRKAVAAPEPVEPVEPVESIAASEPVEPVEPVNPFVAPDEREQLVSELATLGIKAHHKASIDTLKKKLAEAHGAGADESNSNEDIL